MAQHRPNYFSYLLRAWREQESSSWRFSLEGDFGRERIHFSSLETVAQYLSELMQGDSQPGEDGRDDEQPQG